jgi:hypothetical protein
MKENSCQPRLLYPAKLSFIIEEEIKTFHDKQALKEFMTTIKCISTAEYT